jgi:hypothetical protein
MLLQEAQSIREIHRLTGIHRTTIKSYMERFKRSDRTFEDLLSLPDDKLSRLFHPPRSTQQPDARYTYLADHLDYYARELKRRHVTKLILWEEYLQEQPDGYRYAQFCTHLDRYIQQHAPTMPQIHLAGDTVQIDFAGDPLCYYDAVQKKWAECPVLLCTLPYSALFYGEPLTSTRHEHLIPALNHAMNYLGGVPRNVLSDNMAQVVTRPSRYEPLFTDLREILGDVDPLPKILLSSQLQITVSSQRVGKARPEYDLELFVAFVTLHVTRWAKNGGHA